MAIFDGTHQAESLSLQNPEGGICLSQGLEIASRAVFVVQNPSHLTFTSNHPDLSNSGFFGDPPLSISEYCCTLKPTESMIRQISHRSATQFEFVGGDVGITGNSLSGLFVLYALLRARPVFRRGLAGSPSIWWDDRSILRLIDAPLRASGALSCRLFMCAGEDDSPSMATDLTLFSNKLTQAPRNLLAWTTDRFPGLDHYTALPSSFRSGLRWLFADVVSGH
jgi:hypothetical protein